MPRLFDLLNDASKKDLIAEAKKSATDSKRPRNKKNISADKSSEATFSPTTVSIPDFIAIDVETTGLDFKSDRIIEVGAVRFIGGKPEAEFSTFINPGASIPDHITRLTHIGNDDVRLAPPFADIAQSLLDFIGALPLCGHQTEFDITFINEEFKRANFPNLSPQVIDTALFARMLLQRVGRYSLKHTCDALSVTLNNAHRALHDAKASGEAAVKLIPMFCDLHIDVRRAIAAFAPGSMFKTLAIKSLGGARYGINLDGATPFSSQHQKTDKPERHVALDVAQIDNMFSNGGDVFTVVKDFTPRRAQKEMARSVAMALNNCGILSAEAGTGTGKSLAYLIPAALHAQKNNCRIIISTHTRNLQDQLINNDLPAAAAICGNNLRFTKLKGRGNYLCRNRFYALLRGELGNLSPRERNSALPLIVWSQNTVSGDIEEQTFFNPKWFFKIWNLISADGQECLGRRCAYYSTCFLQRARQLAQTSHIVVINHALFYSDVCSETSFLGEIGSIIFDEAHHLESSGHQHLRVEFDTNRATAFIDKLQNLLHAVSANKWFSTDNEFENELKNHLKNIRKRTAELLGEIDKWALSAAESSVADYQIAINESSLRGLLEPAVFDITLGNLQDVFHRFRQILSVDSDKDKVDELRENLISCAERTSQLRADMQYLVSAKTDDHVFWVEGNHEKKWTKLCGVPLDISELLAQIWERCDGGIIFTSATLAIHSPYSGERHSTEPSIDYFARSVGLNSFADRAASVILPSPYGAEQTLFGAFRNCPDPDNSAFAQFVAEAVAAIHSKLGKNTLVLFTANSMLNNVYSQLKSMPNVDKNNLLAQGLGGTRNAMLEQFKAQTGMILLGTDSFWEGVDAPGEACEAVIIPRLPFPVPTHPLTQALGQRMEKLYGSSFFSYSVPEAVIKFRQGIGRLIRSAKDRGALIVLDNRIVTKGYGKQFLKAVGSPVNEFANIDEMIDKMHRFFGEPLILKPACGDDDATSGQSNVRYVPFEDL